MPIDWDREQDVGVVTAGAEPPEDWLAITIRRTLQSSVGNARPSPAIWGRIWQNIADRGPSLSHQEKDSVTLGYKDRLQEVERRQPIRAAGLRQPGAWRLHRKVISWIGMQMVRMGRKLQCYGTTPPLCYP